MLAGDCLREKLAPKGNIKQDIWVAIINDLAKMIVSENRLGMGTLGNFECGPVPNSSGMRNKIGFVGNSLNNNELLTIHGIFDTPYDAWVRKDTLRVWGLVDKGKPRWLIVDFTFGGTKDNPEPLFYEGRFVNLHEIMGLASLSRIYHLLMDQIDSWEKKAKAQSDAIKALRDKSTDIAEFVESLTSPRNL